MHRECAQDGSPMLRIHGRWECVSEYLDRCVGMKTVVDMIQRGRTVYYVFEDGHERIAPNVWEFLGYFMPRKVLAGDTFIEKIAPRVIRKLLRWMADEGLIDRDTMEDYLPGGEREKW